MLRKNGVNADDNGKVFAEEIDRKFISSNEGLTEELLMKVKQAAYDGTEPDDATKEEFTKLMSKQEFGRRLMQPNGEPLSDEMFEELIMSQLSEIAGASCDHNCEHCHSHDEEDDITDEEGAVLMGLFVPALEAACKYVMETAETMNPEDSAKFRKRACIGMLNTIVQSQEQEELCIAGCGFESADELRN